MGSTVLRVDTMKLVSGAKRLVRRRNGKHSSKGRHNEIGFWGEEAC